MLFLTSWIRDRFKIDSGIQDERNKSHVTHVSLRTETIYRQDQDNPKIRKGQFVALTVHSLLILLKFRGRMSKCILQSVI